MPSLVPSFVPSCVEFFRVVPRCADFFTVVLSFFSTELLSSCAEFFIVVPSFVSELCRVL